ncbi:helix-turn-helix transcriptional regulator [Sphingomonas sp.]|uniref:helix-turn-helix transcriptional regulator n=1 Tax=Sphingomonas sp. TaxID=28214 RepID=UPI003B0013F8
MRRAERLFRLVNRLRARHVSRAGDLAAHLEVSVRTVYRDIAHLQASGLPIEGEAGVGYLLRPGFDLPAMTFTFEQLDALAMGLAFVEAAGDAALADAAREARAKLQPALPDPAAHSLTAAPFFAARRDGRAAQAAAVVRSAIRASVVLRLSYADGAGGVSDRRVRPLAIWAVTDGWLVAAWCELREDFRAFRLDRIASVTATGDRFGDDPARDLRAFMAAKSMAMPDR